MSILNDKTEETKKTIHLMVTDKCGRKCKDCCNKLYSVEDIPIIDSKEIMECENLFLTGGEPFLYSSPNELANVFKTFFKNIKNIIVYTNAMEFNDYLRATGSINSIDGVTVSIKCKSDLDAFYEIIKNENVNKLRSNRLYVFDDLVPTEFGNFDYISREWKSVEKDEWRPANDSIFRRLFNV